MKEFKGTPGPWERDSWSVINSNGRKVMFGCLTLSGHTDAEVIANDNIALAAPDLLKALKSLISGYEGMAGSGMFDMLCHGDEIEEANAAIAKALRESK